MAKQYAFFHRAAFMQATFCVDCIPLDVYIEILIYIGVSLGSPMCGGYNTCVRAKKDTVELDNLWA
jgi:hypothetical protein